MPPTGSVCFLLYDGSELVGACGVYVDDFIIVGSPNDKKWQHAKENLRNLPGRVQSFRSVSWAVADEVPALHTIWCLSRSLSIAAGGSRADQELITIKTIFVPFLSPISEI